VYDILQSTTYSTTATSEKQLYTYQVQCMTYRCAVYNSQVGSSRMVMGSWGLISSFTSSDETPMTLMPFWVLWLFMIGSCWLCPWHCNNWHLQVMWYNWQMQRAQKHFFEQPEINGIVCCVVDPFGSLWKSIGCSTSSYQGTGMCMTVKVLMSRSKNWFLSGKPVRSCSWALAS
jgi:hypothetical protein